MELQYKFNNSHLDLMQEQVWEARENIEIYKIQSLREYEQIKKFLPTKPKTIMDLGCGLGRAAILLNSHYNNKNIKFILADRNGRTENTGEFNPKEDQFYNNLEYTHEFSTLNGIEEAITFDTEEDDWRFIPDLDLIVSHCSVGFHVSIERYLDKLIDRANKNCTMIFGIGPNTPYGPGVFQDKFKTVTFQKEEYTEGFPNQSWLILEKPIKVSG